MKKYLIYLIALITTAIAACNPMKDTMNDLNLDGQPYKKTVNLTLTTNYSSVDDANTKIATTLNASYAHLGDGSNANVTYNSVAPAIKPADSLLANIAYTVTDVDYAATNGTTYKNFSAAKVLEFLGTKYPTPVDKQVVVLSYTFYDSNKTTSAGVAVVETFLYLNNNWIKAYQVSQSQYIAAGKFTVYNFSSGDEASLNGYFNTFLKNDATVSATAVAGDVRYVSFAYFASSKTYQRIRTLTYDGTNWGTKAFPRTLSFIKKSGKWIPDPTVYYTLVKADYTSLGTSTAGNATNRANVAQYASFNISATNGTQWTAAEIADALIYILNAKYPNAAVDPTINYVVTYYEYSGTYAYKKMTFVKSSTGFVLVP